MAECRFRGRSRRDSWADRRSPVRPQTGKSPRWTKKRARYYCCSKSKQGGGRTIYEKPSITDYGTIRDLTAALGFFGPEDGASKMIPPHHEPEPTPSLPM
jgi:hypothetical protein